MDQGKVLYRIRDRNTGNFIGLTGLDGKVFPTFFFTVGEAAEAALECGLPVDDYEVRRVLVGSSTILRRVLVGSFTILEVEEDKSAS